MRLRAWLWLSTATLVMVVACGNEESTATSSGTSSTETSGQGAGIPVTQCDGITASITDEACRDCAEGSCCAQLETCQTTSDCEVQFTCVRNCGADTACQAGCGAVGPEAEAALSCMSTCDAAGACDPMSAICDTDVSGGDPACDACLGDSCCAEVKACDADATCAPCLETGDTDGCATLPLFVAFLDCVSASCSAPCEQ